MARFAVKTLEFDKVKKYAGLQGRNLFRQAGNNFPAD